MKQSLLLAPMMAVLAACTTTPVVPPATPAEVEGAAAQERYVVEAATAQHGSNAIRLANFQPFSLIVRRGIGRLPPPLPGQQTVVPRDPTAVLYRVESGWMTSTPTGWRAAKPEQSAALDALLASAEFTAKPTPVFPCPDYGSATLIYRAPPVGRIVRSAACPGVIDRIVTAALEA